jgi:hypothetical protein
LLTKVSKRAGWSLVLAAAAQFLLLNRPAYQGYFQADDLDTLGWARDVSSGTFVKAVLTPRFSAVNFRPVGAFYYYVMENSFGLDFPKYLVPLHALHLLNIWLVWVLARKLGLGPVAASAGAFFFGFHAALMDAWWKPMYVFDLLCGTFSLLTLVLYLYDRWILSLLSFWLAYKSKELAILLPAVLAVYELWLGGKRWKRLVPFFAVSLLFGFQAAMDQSHRSTEYELRVALPAQLTTINFYGSQLFFVPYAWLVLLALPFFIRDRRLWLGLAAMAVLIAPLVLLPGRLFAVYWYVPLIGAAIVLAAFAQGRRRSAIAALFLALWVPWDYLHFRELRRLNQRQERQYRAYATEVQNYARLNPEQRLFVWDYLPDGFHVQGVSGALKCAYPHQDVRALYIDDPGSEELVQEGAATWLHWSVVFNRLEPVRFVPLPQPAPYLTMNTKMPGAQLTSGWYRLDWDYRWTKPDATAVLTRPARAAIFQMVACAAPPQIAALGTIDVQVLLNGRPLGHHAFTAPDCETLRWPVPDGPAGTVAIRFHTAPPYPTPAPDTRVFGIIVKAFGFAGEETSAHRPGPL